MTVNARADARIRGVTGVIVEGGIYLLLLFIPFVLGGVHLWAQGVVQIVTGAIVAAWLLDRRAGGSRTPDAPARRLVVVLWTTIGAFVLVVLFQLAPLPPKWTARLSPGVHALYARTLPGYAEGEGFHAADLSPWLASRAGDRLPPPEVPAAVLEPEMPLSRPPAASAMRPLSIYPYLTRQRLTLLLCLIGLFAVAADHFRTGKRRRRLVAVAVLCGVIVSVLRLVPRLASSWTGGAGVDRLAGTFVNRNSYAAFAGTLLPLALCMALEAFRRKRHDQGLLWSASAVILIAGILRSLSRGGILAAILSIAVVLVLLLYQDRRGTETATLGALVALGIGALFWHGPEQVIERVGTLSDAENVPSFTHRLDVWERSFRLIRDNPALGTGLGTYRFSFMPHAPPDEGWWKTAHNEYIEILCDTGLVGGAMALAGLGTYLLLVVRPARLGRSSDRYLHIGIAAGMAALVFHSMVSAVLQVPANAILLSVLAGVLLHLAGRPDRREEGAS